MPDNIQPVQIDNTGSNKLDYLRNRLAFLQTERSSWLWHWQELNDYIFPRRWRYLVTDRNKGTKKNDKIINNVPTIALRTAAAGMMAGITSPARPWKNFLPPEHLINDYRTNIWLEQVLRIVRQEMIKSNIYSIFHEAYVNLLGFGTPVIYIEETDTVAEGFRGYLFPMGQFCLASSYEGRVDSCYREFSMTVRQLVEQFGINKCSSSVQEMWRQKRYDQWIDVAHAMEPRATRDPDRRDALNKPWASFWWEKSADSSSQKLLRESGFNEQPFMAPRFMVTGEDVYGSCPGMDVLGDCKALQLWERRKAQAIDKIVNPPVSVPSSLKHQRISMLPGDQIPTSSSDGNAAVKPIIELHPSAVTEARNSVYDHVDRIREGFFYNLFRMMQNRDQSPNGGKQPLTATEVTERHEEKMLQLGPVLERLHDELLRPAINRIVHILARKGKLPPPPPQMRGQQVRIEFISIMDQAQKILGTTGVERFTSFLGSVSAVNKEILDNVDFDATAHEYGDMLGIPKKIFRDPEAVQQMRQARAQQAQAAQQMQAVTAGAQAAKAAAGAEVSPDNVLGKLLSTAGGGGGPL